MHWIFFSKKAPPRIAYLALCLAVFAFFTPGIYFAAMDHLLPQNKIALEGFLLGMIVSIMSLAISIAGKIYYRARDNKEGLKFASTIIIVSSVILIIHFGIFIIFLAT